MDPVRECYTIEQSTGCVVARQLSEKDRQIIIGVNGEKAPSQLTESDLVSMKKSSFYEDYPPPLSWNDLMTKRGVKCVDARPIIKQGTTADEKHGSERRLVWFKKFNAEEFGRPSICDKSVKPNQTNRDQDILYTTRHTRALERSQFTKIVDPEAEGSPKSPGEKSKGNEPLSYDDVVELLRQQSEVKACAQKLAEAQKQTADSAVASNHTPQPPGTNANSVMADVAYSRASCTTPQSTPHRFSPLLSPTGSGLMKPLSANSFPPRKEDTALTLRNDDQRRFPSERHASARGPTSAGRGGRLRTGSVLHKTCAAQGTSIGHAASPGEEPPEGTAFINFVNPIFRPETAQRQKSRNGVGTDRLHEVATSMVRERSSDSRSEFVEPRNYPNTPVSPRRYPNTPVSPHRYPNTPVSQACDDFGASAAPAGHADVLEVSAPSSKGESNGVDGERSQRERGMASTEEVASQLNSSASDFQESSKRSNKEEEAPVSGFTGVAVNIPTAN